MNPLLPQTQENAELWLGQIERTEGKPDKDQLNRKGKLFCRPDAAGVKGKT